MSTLVLPEQREAEAALKKLAKDMIKIHGGAEPTLKILGNIRKVGLINVIEAAKSLGAV